MDEEQENTNKQVVKEQVIPDGRRKNFFERKRFINYESPAQEEVVHSGQQRLTTSPEESEEQVSGLNESPSQEHPNKMSKRHPLRNRRRFDNYEV